MISEKFSVNCKIIVCQTVIRLFKILYPGFY